MWFFLLLFLFLPDQAFAWGPGVHLALGNQVLALARHLPSVVTSALCAYPQVFLYGSLSADIFIGKGCQFTPTHSHNWSLGLDLLKGSESLRQQAYAYGYLAHLAADVIAHNYFVPNMLGILPSPGKMAHVFVEMQADREVCLAPGMAKNIFRLSTRVEDRNLLALMNKNKLSFLVKKQIFRGSVLLGGQKNYHRSLDAARILLPTSLRQRYLHRMLLLSGAVIFDVLQHPAQAVACGFDPIGSENLRKIKRLRRKRNSLRSRRGFLFPVSSCLRDLQSDFLPGSFSVPLVNQLDGCVSFRK